MFRLSAVFAVVFTLVLAAAVPSRADLATETSPARALPSSSPSWSWRAIPTSVSSRTTTTRRSRRGTATS